MTPFLPMPLSLFEPAEFCPASSGGSNRSGANNFTPAGSGTAVDASVQPKAVRRAEPDGSVVTLTEYHVFLRADPSPLNGGAGVRESDGFRVGGLLLVAQGPALRPGPANAAWKVVCLSVE